MDNTTTGHGPYYDERVSFASSGYNAGFSLSLYIDGGIRSVAALASLNEALDRPFGTAPLVVRALAWTLHQDGFPIEYRSPLDGNWRRDPKGQFDAATCYRVAPKGGMPVCQPATEFENDF